MRDKLLRLGKIASDFAAVPATIEKAHEDASKVISDIKKAGGGSISHSAAGSVGILTKALSVHRQLIDASDKLARMYKSGHASLEAAIGASNANAGPASGNSTGNRDLTSPGEIHRALTPEVIKSIIDECTHGGIVNPNELHERLAKATLATTDLYKVAKQVTGGRVNPNATNPLWGPTAVECQ
jgi:hypothetical protein